MVNKLHQWLFDEHSQVVRFKCTHWENSIDVVYTVLKDKAQQNTLLAQLWWNIGAHNYFKSLQ